MYWNDVEVLRQLNIQFKNTCIWWWPCKVSAYIFIHTFSIVQAWQDINSQVVHINQFSILNAFHVILLSTEYTIHFYKKIHLFNQAFAKQSAITRGLIELNSYRILAQPMAQCEQHRYWWIQRFQFIYIIFHLKINKHAKKKYGIFSMNNENNWKKNMHFTVRFPLWTSSVLVIKWSYLQGIRMLMERKMCDHL